MDGARTLARSAQVSRYWNQLLQDEQTWKDMCDRHRFSAIQSPIHPHFTHPRSGRAGGLSAFHVGSSFSSPTIFGMSSKKTPTGSRDFRINSFKQAEPRRFVDMGSASPPDNSFKQHFKNAYLTGQFLNFRHNLLTYLEM